jgi:LacI family transcriptional regulator
VRVTMMDVAQRAGVSVATVSHVINGTRNVSDEVAARVIEAINDTGYRRHDLARALKRARTDSVGLVVADTGHPIFAEVVHGVDEQAQKSGQMLLLANTGDDRDRERKVVEALRERRVDGLLLVPAVGSARVAEQLASEGFPVVVLDRLVAADIDQVGVDSEPALRRLSAHLMDGGHRRIVIVAGTLDLQINVDRVEVCVRELEQHGIARDEITVLETSALAEHAIEAATQVVLDHLDGSAPASGMITLNAHQTLGALEALDQAGRSVPDDMAVVAFDDLPLGSLSARGVTCAAQPATEMGQRALQLLLRRIDDASASPEIVRLPCTLIHRSSCGCGNDQPL